MAHEWKMRRIGDLGRVVTGKTPSTDVAENFGGQYPFITIPDLGAGRTVSVTNRTLSERGATVLSSCRLPAGSVMMSCIATIGKCGITTKTSFTNQQINSVICGPGVDPDFLYYCFKSLGPAVEAAGAGGSVFVNVSKSRFEQLEIPLPSLAEQRSISGILAALDDKIELNQRMNVTLGAMARALFRSWFVDFDPISIRPDGSRGITFDGVSFERPPATLLGGSLGPLAHGWAQSSLDQIADFLNGLALQRYPAGEGPALPVVKISQLRRGDTLGADWCSAKLPSDYIVGDGDVIFSWSGSLEVKIWCGGTGALNQHLFKVSSNQFPKWFYYLWTLHHLDDFRLIAADKATTMGHIQRGHLTAAKVLVPPRPLLDAMTRVMEPLIDRVIANQIQSRTLATLRDTLLPKVLSGELSVSSIRSL